MIAIRFIISFVRRGTFYGESGKPLQEAEQKLSSLLRFFWGNNKKTVRCVERFTQFCASCSKQNW